MAGASRPDTHTTGTTIVSPARRIAGTPARARRPFGGVEVTGRSAVAGVFLGDDREHGGGCDDDVQVRDVDCGIDRDVVDDVPAAQPRSAPRRAKCGQGGVDAGR